MLTSRTEILSLKPGIPALGNLKLGVVAPWDPLRDGKDAFFEVRAFISNRATESPSRAA
ncbi:hypothetical protein [Streptomyces griseus]